MRLISSGKNGRISCDSKAGENVCVCLHGAVTLGKNKWKDLVRGKRCIFTGIVVVGIIDMLIVQSETK